MNSLSLSVSVQVSRAAGARARILPGAALAALGVLIAGCAADSSVNKYVPNIVTPYRMDIQQGNFVTQDMVDKLQKGQTRDQVRFILGTPLLTDVFHANRWDYIFRSSKGWNDPEKHKLTVMFDAGPDGKLSGWESDVPPPKSAEVVEDKPGFFGGLFGGKSAAPKPASPSPAVPSPAGAAAPAAGASGASSPPAAAPAPTAAREPAAAPKPADLPNLSSSQAADKEQEKKPSLLRRMFGWMPGVSTEDAAAGAARAASPENTPLPRPGIAEPPKAAPAEPPPATGTVSVGPAVQETVQTPAPPPAPAAAPAPGSAPPPVPEAMPSGQAAPDAGGVTPVTLTAQATPAPAAASAAAQPVLTPDGVIASVERWRAAWQAKDVTRYLASYAPDFRAPGNLSRAKWEAQRRDRLTKPSFIVVKVIDPQVTLGKDDVAVAVFVQEYESNLLKESGRKTLRMARYGSDWLILEEMAK